MKKKEDFWSTAMNWLIDWDIAHLPPSKLRHMPPEERLAASRICLSFCQAAAELIPTHPVPDALDGLFRSAIRVTDTLSPAVLDAGWEELLRSRTVAENPLWRVEVLYWLARFPEKGDESAELILALEFPETTSSFNHLERKRGTYVYTVLQDPTYFPVSPQTRINLANLVIAGRFNSLPKREANQLMQLAKQVVDGSLPPFKGAVG